MTFAVVYVTVPSMKLATELSTLLLEKRLVACINAIPQVTSIYSWNGGIQTDQEVLMVGSLSLSLFHSDPSKENNIICIY